jgi:UDP-glucose 4-epimerase
VLDLTGSSSELVFVPYDRVYGQGIDEMFHRAPAIDRIEAAIGWRPQRSLDDILDDVIESARTAATSAQRLDSVEAP